jgi:diguanylate cyclase (GGDEF)-like protein
MLDIDFFKRVNDSYGHQCGDFVLQTIAQEVALMIRKVDFLARYGGEEFCCLLPETPLDVAMTVAERIRERIEKREFQFLDIPFRITVSMGVSELRSDIVSHEVFLRKADEALYNAKRMGRNKVAAMG